MPARLSLPANVSYGEGLGDGRSFAPAAARNGDAIAQVIAEVAPHGPGKALEIASGTGQHVVQFAPLRPALTWQPSDAEPARLTSIDAWVRVSGLSNILPACQLDASASGWAGAFAPVDLVLIVNLLHLVSEGEARATLTGAAQAMAAGSVLVLYGPFLRDGQATSEGDREFDARLRAADPEVGYKDVARVTGWLKEAGLAPEPPRLMPANNLCLVARA